MLHKLKSREGFASMVEVIVSSVFFFIVAFGILASITMLKSQGNQSVKKLEAVNIGRQVMENLRATIDASTWDQPGSPFEPDIVHTEQHGEFTVTYTLVDVPGQDLREMQLTVSYPDEE